MSRVRISIVARSCGALLVLLLASSRPVHGEDVRVAEPAHDEVRVTSADDLSLFVRQYGAGETPVVVLTGGPGYSGDYLKEVAMHLGEQHLVLLPDQRGTGRSIINPWDASRLSIEACVADIEAIRVHSGAEQIVVLGHSWGGVLALAYAAQHGERLRALVLVGSGGATSNWNMRYSRNILLRLESSDMAAVLQAQARMAKEPEAGMVDMIRATAPAMMMDRELAFRSADEYAGPATLTPAVTLAMQAWLQQYDISDGLEALDLPVLIVQGEHDPIGAETARENAELFARSEVHFLADAAHEPYVEQAAAFYRLVDPFLLKHAGQPEQE